MSAVGLLLPGWASPREAALMTLLVGALQVSTPTTLIIRGIADARTVFTASGLYLLGFTYLKGNQRRDQLERTGPGLARPLRRPPLPRSTPCGRSPRG